MSSPPPPPLSSSCMHGSQSNGRERWIETEKRRSDLNVDHAKCYQYVDHCASSVVVQSKLGKIGTVRKMAQFQNYCVITLQHVTSVSKQIFLLAEFRLSEFGCTCWYYVRRCLVCTSHLPSRICIRGDTDTRVPPTAISTFTLQPGYVRTSQSGFGKDSDTKRQNFSQVLQS